VPIARIETHECRLRSPNELSRKKQLRASMPLIPDLVTTFTTAPPARPVTARRHAELLDHLVRKLVRCTIPSRCLRKRNRYGRHPIHQEARVISPNPTIRKVAVRSPPQASRILRHSGHRQQQIRKPAPVQRQIFERPLIQPRRYRTRIQYPATTLRLVTRNGSLRQRIVILPCPEFGIGR
jgi:hypothetical protein